MHFQDDTEYNSENNELVNLGLIFGTPSVKGDGIEVVYKGRKIIISPTQIKKAIPPIPRIKKNIRYEVTPAYLITDGKSGMTLPKDQARSWLKKLKKYLDDTIPDKIIHNDVVYEAWDLNTITNKYSDTLHQYLAKSNNVDVNVITAPEVKLFIDEIYDVDPSSDKKYLGSIVKWILTKSPEDLSTQIKPYLQKFKKLLDSNPGKYGSVSRDISKGKYTLDQFKDIVNKEYEALSGSDNINAAIRIKEKTGDFNIIGENENYVCYIVDDFIEDEKSDELISHGQNHGKKHFCFNGDVDWCVKYRPAFENYKPPYYYFLNKVDGKEFALMHVNSLQLKDVRDNTLNEADYLKIQDIIVPILLKSDIPLDDFSETDFPVVIENLDIANFNKIFGDNVPTILENAIDKFDYVMLDKLFSIYPSEILLRGNGMDITESSLIASVKYMVKNSGHKSYLLSTDTWDTLFNEFGADEYRVYKDTVTRFRREDTIDRKSLLIKWLITDGWVRPNELISLGREDETAFELAVTSRNILAVEEFLKIPDTDVNTQNIESNGSTNSGYSPLLYVSNLSGYENDTIFNMLVNDPRANVNVYMEEYSPLSRKWEGRSVLDHALEDRVELLKSKGALHYVDIPNTNNGKSPK